MVFSPILPTSINLTWEQPEGANAVESYEINYQYTIQQCDIDGNNNIIGNFPSVNISLNDSILRSYTLHNSASTPVEECSLFRISLTAINSVTRSVPSQSIITNTTEAGINSYSS